MLTTYIKDIPTTVTYDAYKTVPLANLSCGARGNVLEDIVRRVLEEITGDKTQDADVGRTITGKKRGRNQSSFDFYLNDRRCEVKSSQLTWDKHAKRWTAQFHKIKRGEYDDLYLALYTPFGIDIYKHDDVLGICTHGKSQESTGGCVKVLSQLNEESIETAIACIRDKMKHMFCKHVSLDELKRFNIPTTVTHDTYQNVPLANLSSSARGDVIEIVVRRVLEEITGEKTQDADVGTTVSGTKCGLNSSSFDFYLVNRKCEVKSSQLTWDKHGKKWIAQFHKIKRGEYDDLYLALYTPFGIDIYKHDDVLGTCTTGKSQKSTGGYVKVCASRNEESIEIATACIRDKMKHMLVKTLYLK